MANDPKEAWQGKPIAGKHSDRLEVDSALNEFKDRMPRAEAEKKAYEEYKKGQHTDGAIHHLRAMRAAQAASDDEAATKHSALFTLHMKELGHDPYGELPKEIQEKLKDTKSLPPVRKFHAHRSDALVAKDKEEVKKNLADFDYTRLQKALDHRWTLDDLRKVNEPHPSKHFMGGENNVEYVPRDASPYKEHERPGFASGDPVEGKPKPPQPSFWELIEGTTRKAERQSSEVHMDTNEKLQLLYKAAKLGTDLLKKAEESSSSSESPDELEKRGDPKEWEKKLQPPTVPAPKPPEESVSPEEPTVKPDPRKTQKIEGVSSEVGMTGSAMGAPLNQSEKTEKHMDTNDIKKAILEKKAPPGFSEETMHKLKRKHGVTSAFKIAWAAHNRKSGKKGETKKSEDAPFVEGLELTKSEEMAVKSLEVWEAYTNPAGFEYEK